MEVSADGGVCLPLPEDEMSRLWTMAVPLSLPNIGNEKSTSRNTHMKNEGAPSIKI